jgi:hypothetical protein
LRVFPILLTTVLTLTACLGELPAPAHLADADNQLSIYAAAAREYKRSAGEWPHQVDQLLSVMTGAPSAAGHPVILRGLKEDNSGSLAIAFESESSSSTRRLRGAIHVSPPHMSGAPAAVLKWKYGGLLPSGSGSVHMQECALGEYALPDEEAGAEL